MTAKLSPGFLFLNHVELRAHIAKSLINTCFTVPALENMSYVFKSRNIIQEKSVEQQEQQQHQTNSPMIPIFVQDDQMSSCPVNVPNCAVMSFDSVDSTHSIVEALIANPVFDSIDLLVTSKEQTQGRGRRGQRVWCSPEGCAMFSFTHQFKSGSVMAQHIGFLQHLVALSIVQSVPQIPDLKIKWPNDIYYKKAKIAGLVVNCRQMHDQQLVALIGIGINVDNRNPSDCLNRILRQDLMEDRLISRTDLISNIVNNFKQSASQIKTEQDFDLVKNSYTKRWMHSGQEISYRDQQLMILGVDGQGFLVTKAKTVGHEIVIGSDFDDISLPVI